MSRTILTRRTFLGAGAAGASSLVLGGCDALNFLGDRGGSVRDVLEKANDVTYYVQRFLIGDALAREYAESEIRQGQRPNGSTDPQSAEYLALRANDFADYRLSVTGLVEAPKNYSLAELRNMPSRTQITRHDCVEGWSCIGKWKGVRLRTLLDRARLKPNVRYIVFYCADALGSTGTDADKYYESVGLADAFHEQTILAYEMNDNVLPIAHGAPLRLRVERQLGYKMAKYVMRIDAVESLSPIRGGRGGFWEDRGYEWYAGI